MDIIKTLNGLIEDVDNGDIDTLAELQRELIHLRSELEQLTLTDVMAMLPTTMINRIEVIDENGRSYVNWKPTNRIELQVQDNGRTLKVFVSQGN